jgi:imidazolonepropionase-like amidohydrolase
MREAVASAPRFVHHLSMPRSRSLAALLLALSASVSVAARAADASDAPATLITNVRIFDGREGQLSPPSQILVEGRHIAAVSRGPIDAPANTRVIDGGGRVATPGFIDTHVHLMLSLPMQTLANATEWYIAAAAADNMRRMLYRGFTTVRDTAGADGSIARAVEDGLIEGPRVFPSGPGISQTGGHGDFRPGGAPHPVLAGIDHFRSFRAVGVLADGRADVLRAARENLKNGATQIKIMGGGGVTSEFDPLHSVQYTPEEVRAAVQAAENWGTYVVAHAYHDRSVRMLIDNGVRQIVHGHLLDEKTIRYAARKGVYIQAELIWSRMNDEFGRKVGLGEERLAKNRRILDRSGAYFDLLRKHEVKTAFGTDILGPYQHLQNREFTLRAAHFEPAEVLRQATSLAFELIDMSGPLNRYGRFGVIEEGALADILVIEGNPLEDISILERPEEVLRLIMKDGRVHKRTLPGPGD